MDKFCVFCGDKPDNKNREHVLPFWLLKMTGDPNRTVKFSYDFLEKKNISFHWSSFTVPACEKCNTKYGKLESEVKPIIEKIQNKSEIIPLDILKLLDWLDKVRIGLWINYYFLEKNKGGINPKLCIDNRIGRKDRFLQIYFLESKISERGLNAFGVESFVFQFNPSCFGLKINNVLIINGSNDFIISKNCGFPYPQKMKILENEILELTDWKFDRETSPEIDKLVLHKAVLTVFQPIHSLVRYDLNYFSNTYLIQNCIDINKKIGTLFRIENDKINPIYDFFTPLPYEIVSGDAIKYVGQIISKVYEGQNVFLSNYIEGSEDIFIEAMKINNIFVDFYNNPH